MTLLFLDFDGVTHPETSEADRLFCRTPLLWQLLRACPEVQVVFSTSWREIHRPEELLDFVTHGGGEDLTHRFIGSTPVLKSGEHRFHREAECREWLRLNGCKHRPWLALDDTDFGFAGSNLHLVNHLTGLITEDVLAITERLNSEAAGNYPGLPDSSNKGTRSVATLIEDYSKVWTDLHRYDETGEVDEQVEREKARLIQLLRIP